MSISNLLVQQVYTTNGVTVSFPIPFAFLPGDAESVTKVYAVDLADGGKILQVIGALNDYTLPHDVDTEPANVVFNTAPNNCDILVTRVLTLAQAIEFINSGQGLLDNIEEGMDILTMLIQQVNELAQKSVRLHEIVTTSAFDPVLPVDIAQIANANTCPITNEDAAGWAPASTWPTGDNINNAQEYANEAEASAAAAAASATAASGSGTAAALAAASAAVSSAAAALSAAAAAETGFDDGATHAVTDGQASTDLTGEILDHTVNTSGIWFFEIIRGTAMFANGWISPQYINGSWRVAIGPYAGELHGVTWAINSSTGQLAAALDSGAGNGTIKIKKTAFST